MPQPFKRRGRPMNMHPSIIAEDRDFAVLIALVSTHWNQIEFNLATMYTWLLIGQEPSAFNFYHDLIDLSLREKAFLAAARGRLSQDLIDEVCSFYTSLRKLSGRRSKIVHGVWAKTPSKPASLFLCDPRAFNDQLNKLLRYVVEIKKEPSKVLPRISFDVLPDEFTEYHVRDFQTIMTDLVSANEKSVELGNRVLAQALEASPR